MVASSAAVKKLPLFMVGKSNKPECFSLCGDMPSMAYIHQANAWFDRDVPLHWINTVLWPWRLAHHGNVSCLLLLDNCPAHANLETSFLQCLLFIFSSKLRLFPTTHRHGHDSLSESWLQGQHV